MERRQKGWCDLLPEEFVEAIENLDKRGPKSWLGMEVGDLIKRVEGLRTEGLISEGEAKAATEHLESLKDK